jgi:thiosulfate reductase cytochrome b subunit
MHQAGGVVPGAARASLREAKMSAHPWPVRLTHWMNAAAMTVMIMSGWRIYDASPLFPFVIPAWLTLGDWLGGALACHFAAMWLLATNFTAYLLFGLRSGHIRRRLLPLSTRAIVRDLTLALRFRLPHAGGDYNAVQKLLYVLAGCGIAGAIVSGLALWKPVQLAPLTMALGGYEAARRVHFAAMSGLVAFVVLHVALVAIVPRTLLPMITGRVEGPR